MTFINSEDNMIIHSSYVAENRNFAFTIEKIRFEESLYLFDAGDIKVLFKQAEKDIS
jgi:hypothetical protein